MTEAKRHRRRRRIVWLGTGLAALMLLITGVLAIRGASAARPDLKPFFGAFVGVAEVNDLKAGIDEQRDMDIVIEPYDPHGFKLRWVNVTLVDGRRDVPGVERHVQSVLFEPADDRDLFVEIDEGNPFREREETRPMRGDPLRWAQINAATGTMHVYTFVILDDGRYELQVYDRVLTDVGIDIAFERIVDGEVMKRINGHTVRANIDTEDE